MRAYGWLTSGGSLDARLGGGVFGKSGSGSVFGKGGKGLKTGKRTSRNKAVNLSGRGGTGKIKGVKRL